MKTINYKSDFKLIEEFKDNSSIKIPFEFTYYTRSIKDNYYKASFDGTKYKGCNITNDGKLMVIFEDHQLKPGQLKVQRKVFLHDEDFEDNTCTLISDESLNIYLDKNSISECDEVTSKVQTYYHAVDIPTSIDTSNLVTTNTIQNIEEKKNFTKDIVINDKSVIKSNISNGELKVTHAGSTRGFIARTNWDNNKNIMPLELLATNGIDNSYSYKFPEKSGTVALLDDIKAGGNTGDFEQVINKEIYYNDGSNEVVPIKHPDLSTQPSILPYKFMGNYVYEQLIPINSDIVMGIGGGGAYIPIKGFAVNKPIFLSVELIGEGIINPLSCSSGIKYNDYFNEYMCSFKGTEYVNADDDYKYIHAVYTSMPEEGGDYYYGDSIDYLDDLSTSGIHNGYEYVDLGLPSGLKWARCNIGASSPEEPGLYFAWGETVGYNESDVKNGIHGFYIEDYKFSDGDWSCDGSSMTRYNSYDNLTTLTPIDDAASVNMGGSWRMPSNEEYEELLNNTTNIWTTINGVNGRLFTGYNGNTLFFPASGNCGNGFVDSINYEGCYWSSSVNTYVLGTALYLNLYPSSCSISHYVRPNGYAVRGVVS